MSDGLSFFDLGELPVSWRTVLRYVMRHNPATHTEVHKALASARLPAAELDDVLQTLCDEGYLTPENRDDSVIFRLNVARKSINRAVNQQIWNALGLENSLDIHHRTYNPAFNDEEPLRRGGRRKLDVAIWESLETEDEPAAPNRTPNYPVTTRLWDTLTQPTNQQTNQPTNQQANEPASHDAGSEPPTDSPSSTSKPRRRSMWDALDESSDSDA